MRTTRRPLKLAALALCSVAIVGCHDYVKKADYDSTISELRGTDQNLQSQIDGLSQKYDTLAKEVAGRVRIESGAHFATNDATLSEQDKPFLADFAKTLGGRTDAIVTVEGFADPQGATGYNRELGMRRADAVAEFLASNGMNSSQLRTVSYGEDKNRQVRPGQIGPEGQDNRRVSLVIDYAGNSGAAPPPPTEAQPAPTAAPPPDEQSGG